MAKCHAKNSSGSPCGVPALKGERFCFSHSPGTRAQQARARKIGGLNRHTPHAGNLETIPAEIATVQDASLIVRYVLSELLEMDNSIPRARALLACFDAYTRAFELGEIELRLQALEAKTK